jgi:hypothetical protein
MVDLYDLGNTFYLVILPVFLKVTTNTSKHFMLLLPPVYWRLDKSTSNLQTLVFFPFVWYFANNNGGYRFFLVPFVSFLTVDYISAYKLSASLRKVCRKEMRFDVEIEVILLLQLT